MIKWPHISYNHIILLDYTSCLLQTWHAWDLADLHPVLNVFTDDCEEFPLWLVSGHSCCQHRSITKKNVLSRVQSSDYDVHGVICVQSTFSGDGWSRAARWTQDRLSPLFSNHLSSLWNICTSLCSVTKLQLQWINRRLFGLQTRRHVSSWFGKSWLWGPQDKKILRRRGAVTYWKNCKSGGRAEATQSHWGTPIRRTFLIDSCFNHSETSMCSLHIFADPYSFSWQAHALKKGYFVPSACCEIVQVSRRVARCCDTRSLDLTGNGWSSIGLAGTDGTIARPVRQTFVAFRRLLDLRFWTKMILV